jgi:hypothetical protein
MGLSEEFTFLTVTPSKSTQPVHERLRPSEAPLDGDRPQEAADRPESDRFLRTKEKDEIRSQYEADDPEHKRTSNSVLLPGKPCQPSRET